MGNLRYGGALALGRDRPAMPYIDRLLPEIAEGDPEANEMWARHLHFGYWEDPRSADGSFTDFADAGEAMAQLVCESAGIGDGMRVLDCGCGIGGALASLNERFTGMELVGVNIDPRQLEVARRRVEPRPGNSIEFVEADACQLPFAASSFDAVIAVECIFHFSGRTRFLREVRRVLRPGGQLGVADIIPHWTFLPMYTLATFGAFYAPVNPLPPTGTSYRLVARRAGLRQLGLRDVTPNTMPTYPVLAKYLRTRSRKGELQVKFGRLVSRRGLVRYVILSFVKDAGRAYTPTANGDGPTAGSAARPAPRLAGSGRP